MKYNQKFLFLETTNLQLYYFFSISFFIFIIGFLIFIFNSLDILKSFFALELMFLSVSFNFMIFSIFFFNSFGQIYSLFILALAAIDSVIGLSILIITYKINDNVFLNKLF